MYSAPPPHVYFFHDIITFNVTPTSHPSMAFSLPGLGSADETIEPSPNQTNAPVVFTTHSLSAKTEYRFEVPHGKIVRLKLLTGTAEIFGTELVISSTPYTFTGCKLALYTWQGCTFEISGEVSSEYVGEETMMDEYFACHSALHALRESAQRTESTGPRVLVLGPENVGKSTLCKILTGYAVRGGWSPVVVNLDSQGEGMLSLPGTMSAGVFKSGLDIESVNGWGESPMSGPSGSVPVKLPLVYHYGLESIASRSGAVYKSLSSKLALAVLGRLQSDPEAHAAGLLIDTPGILSSGKLGSISSDIIAHIVSEFSVNAIICLGSERLYSDIVKQFDGRPSSSSTPGESISVIKLARSGGCIERDAAFMTTLRAAQIKSYFYGAPTGTGGVVLSPRQQTVEFASLTVYRCLGDRSTSLNGHGYGAGGGGFEDDDFAPGGGDESFSFYSGDGEISSKVPLPATQLLECITTPSHAMQSAVLAIMNCEPEAEETEIRSSSVMGYVYVTEVDEVRRRIGLLSPVAGRIPGRALLWGEWPEGVLGLV
jgi:polyribonucleotide 5'-hydroxyl-kinase